MKNLKRICLLAGTVLMSCTLFWGCGGNREQTPTNPVTLPTAATVKQPSEYTWEEYLAMTEEEKLEFQQKFGSREIFEAWMEAVRWEDTDPEQLVLPWENGGKQPDQYTWEEFVALDAGLQIAFQNALGWENFEIWMEQAQSLHGQSPWDENGSKQPGEYTWEEFEELSADHQIAFQNALGESGFQAWMEQAQGRAEDCPWEKPGSKQPGEYTWEEFEALSAEHQIAFQNALGADNFVAWMEQARNQQGEHPWDKPGSKQPEEYTWAEFEALRGDDQIAFQNAMGMDAFIEWMERVNP